MKLQQLRNIFFVILLALIGFACSDSTTGSGAAPAKIEGRVQSNSSSNKAKSGSDQISAVEGAVVTAAKVTANGKLETIENTETKTNAQGEFTVEVSADAITNNTEHIVVVAKKSDRKWEAFISGQLQSGSTVKVKPLSVESSGEANVYRHIVADGQEKLVTKADIDVCIGVKVAEELKGNDDIAAELATALEEQARARAKYFSQQSVDISDQAETKIKEAKANAEMELQNKLEASSSESAKSDAYKAFGKAIVKAYLDAGIDASAYAEAQELSGRVLVKNCTHISSDARSEVRAKASYVAAVAINMAVQAQLKAVNAEKTSIQAAEEAGVQLQSDISSKATASKDEINKLFESFNGKIVDILKTEFSADSQTVVDINSKINDTAGIKAKLESSVEASGSTDVIVEAYMTFVSGCKSTVKTLFSDVTDTEAKVLTNIMVLINIAA